MHVRKIKVNGRTSKQVPSNESIPVITYGDTRENRSSVLAKNTRRKYISGPERKKLIYILRMKIITRKFGYIWFRKVFGCLLFSQAIYHHKSKKLRCIISFWHEYTWIHNHEWKCIIRADFHYRLKLTELVLYAWKNFVSEQKRKQKQLAIAVYHADKQIARNVFKQFHLLLATKAQRMKMFEKAILFDTNRLIRLSFYEWRTHLETVLERRRQVVIALQFWSLNRINFAFQSWKAQYHESIVYAKEEEKSNNNHRNVLKRKMFRLWRNYISIHHSKKALNNQAYIHRCRSLVKKAYFVWQDTYQRSLVNRMHFKSVFQIFNRMLLKHSFDNWKLYLKISREETMFKERAESEWCKCLKRRSLRRLKAYAGHQKVEKYLKSIANSWFDRSLTIRTWRFWISKVDFSEEQRLLQKSRLAIKNYGKCLKRKAFRQLVSYAYNRRTKKLLFAKVDYFYFSHGFPRYFVLWKQFVSNQKNKRKLRETANGFFKSNALKKYFRLWESTFNCLMDYQMGLRLAILHNEEILVAKAFNHWTFQWRCTLRLKELTSKANEFLHHRMLNSAFYMWKAHFLEMRNLDEHHIFAIEFSSTLLLKKHFQIWRKVVSEEKRLKTMLRKSKNHYELQLLRKIVSMLKKHLNNCSNLNLISKDYGSRMIKKKLSKCFEKWKVKTTQEIDERRKYLIACHHHKHSILYQAFNCWFNFHETIQNRNLEMHKAFSIVKRQLNFSKTHRLFRKWNALAKERLHCKSLLNRADSFYRQSVLNIYFSCWQNYVDIKRRKAVLSVTSMRFYKRMNSSKFLAKWRLSLEIRKNENQQTVLSLWLWSFHIKKRVFRVLRAYTEKRKSKSLKYREANLYRQAWLQREVFVMSVLKGDAQLELKKHLKFRATSTIKTKRPLSTIVVDCALHWLWETRKRTKIVSSTEMATSGVVGIIENPHQFIKENKTIEDSFSKRIQSIVKSEASHVPPVLKVPTPPIKKIVSMPKKKPSLPQLTVSKKKRQPRLPEFLRSSMEREGINVPRIAVDDKLNESISNAHTTNAVESSASEFNVSQKLYPSGIQLSASNLSLPSEKGSRNSLYMKNDPVERGHNLNILPTSNTHCSLFKDRSIKSGIIEPFEIRDQWKNIEFLNSSDQLDFSEFHSNLNRSISEKMFTDPKQYVKEASLLLNDEIPEHLFEPKYSHTPSTNDNQLTTHANQLFLVGNPVNALESEGFVCEVSSAKPKPLCSDAQTLKDNNFLTNQSSLNSTLCYDDLILSARTNYTESHNLLNEERQVTSTPRPFDFLAAHDFPSSPQPTLELLIPSQLSSSPKRACEEPLLLVSTSTNTEAFESSNDLQSQQLKSQIREKKSKLNSLIAKKLNSKHSRVELLEVQQLYKEISHLRNQLNISH